MRAKFLALRILQQLRHDKRTLALMMIAPILVLSLLYFILTAPINALKVAVINAPLNVIDRLEANNLIAVRYDEIEATRALQTGEVIAAVKVISGKYYIQIDGSDPGKATRALTAIEASRVPIMPTGGLLPLEVEYVYGSEDSEAFDSYGSALIGFMVFFFVFLVAGISFLQERNSGTLEKLLSTPIKRWEIVLGYVLGFGLVTVAQSFLISWYCIYVLDMVLVGSFALVLLITLLAAMVALTLGILASTAANNEFQMMQFIPVVIIPQVFFSGLFNIPSSLVVVERVMPLYYVADALNKVMIKGSGMVDIWLDLIVMLGCALLFILANIKLLKRYRRI